MAALYGTLEGHRGVASRLGTKASGILSRVQTWNSQIRVDLDADGTAVVTLRDLKTGHSSTLWQGNADKLASMRSRRSHRT